MGDGEAHADSIKLGLFPFDDLILDLVWQEGVFFQVSTDRARAKSSGLYKRPTVLNQRSRVSKDLEFTFCLNSQQSVYENHSSIN